MLSLCSPSSILPCRLQVESGERIAKGFILKFRILAADAFLVLINDTPNGKNDAPAFGLKRVLEQFYIEPKPRVTDNISSVRP